MRKVGTTRSVATTGSGLVKTAAGILLVSAALSIMHTLSTDFFSLPLFFSLLLVLASSVILGMVLVNVLSLNEQERIDFIPAFLVGMIALTVILLILAFLSPLGMTGNLFLILFSIGMFISVKFGRKTLAKCHEAVNQLYLDKTGFWSLIVILITSGLWSTENLEGLSFPSLGAIEIHPWIDVCLTARQISLFMNSSGPGSLSNIYMSGQHMPVYHYGSYLITALLGSLSGVSSFSLATATLAPLGFIWTGLAAYTLGKTFVDQRTGFMAVVGLLLIPDASYIGLGNRWSGYFFFQQVGMGGAYAVSVLAIAWNYAIKATRSRSTSLLTVSLALCAISALFKVTIAIVYVIPFLIFIAIYFRKFHWSTRIGMLLAVGIAYCLVVNLIRWIPNAPTLRFSTQGAYLNLSTLINLFDLDRAKWLTNLLMMSDSYFWRILIGVPLILMTTYGIWIFILPFILGYIFKTHYSSYLAVIPVLTILSHLIIALCLSPNLSVVNDPFEIIHKTFVWPYFLIAVCCSSILGIGTSDKYYKHSVTGKAFLILFLVIGIYKVGIMAKTVQTGFPLAKLYTKLKFPRGLYEAAEYIRLNTPKNSIVQYSGNDDYCTIAGFSERYTYVLHLIVNRGGLSEVEKHRFITVENILNQQDISVVRKMAETVGIDWFIVGNQRKFHWQNQANAAPVFQYDGFRVYDMKG